MSKNIAIISTDWHIEAGNVELSKSLAAQQIQLAKDSGTDWLICLGDVFESRKAQPEFVLNCFSDILDMIQEAGMHLTVIPGNHDKTDSTSWSSFLHPFMEHPAIDLIEKSGWRPYNDKIVLLFQAYARDDKWMESLNELLTDDGLSTYDQLYLFSHQAFCGAFNNDGTKVDNAVNQQTLLAFTKSYFGHYHNYQEPFMNAFQLSSWKQKNFGEDDKKGFWLLQEVNGQLDVEFHQSDFPVYMTFEIQASELTPEKMESVAEEVKDSPYKFCLKILGTTDEIKSISTKSLQEAGIKIKSIDLTEKKMIDDQEEVKDFEKDETVVESFKMFCEEKGYDYEEGIEYLKLALKNE